jgi:cytochrome c oxidase cbb3-type subunit II
MKPDSLTSDRPPQITNASYLFAWAISSFLIAIIIASLAIPSNPIISPEGSNAIEIGRGARVFNGEGCANCHSMMVRFEDRGMGSSATGDLMFSRNDYPGSIRIGTDLQNIAGRYPESLLQLRLTEPEAIHPGTVMPSYSYLSETRRDQLIAYLERPALIPGGLEAMRSVNSIEAAVPDEVLLSLLKYLDLETGLIIPPVASSEIMMITASGIYNSRCAVCHGLDGRGDGPVYSTGNRPGAASPLIPPGDFTSDAISGKSGVMLYWRTSEGVPGTGMPSWGGTLSEDAIWLLVSYVQSLGAKEENAQSELSVSVTENNNVVSENNLPVVEEIDEVSDVEQGEIVEPTSVVSEEIKASEEDGGEITEGDGNSESPGVTDGTGPESPSDSIDEIPSGEESP